MRKYEPLQRHLRRQKGAIYDMSFFDIERVLGALLPRRAHRPDWWENAPTPDAPPAPSRAWLDAGFDATLEPGADRVRFRRR